MANEGSADTEIHRLFDLGGRVAVITGGAGLLGPKHAEVIAQLGGIPVLIDIDQERSAQVVEDLAANGYDQTAYFTCDISNPDDVSNTAKEISSRFGKVDILINNAANNPQMDESAAAATLRLENLPLAVWNHDLAVGLTGAFLCAQAFGTLMADTGGGVIVNIGSDLSIIGPDQGLYRTDGVDEDRQAVKPVSYSVVKAGLIGLTRYLATYWAGQGVRANCLAPGGIENDQPPEFVSRLIEKIPLGRMAKSDEYMGVIAFLVSDASSYMTGAVVSVDGGRTAW